MTDAQRQTNERIIKIIESSTKAMATLEHAFKNVQKAIMIFSNTINKDKFLSILKKTNQKHYGPERMRKKGKIRKWEYPS